MLVVTAAAISIIILTAAMTLLNQRSPENATIGGLGDTGMMASIHRYCDGKGIYSKHGLNVTYVPFRDSYTMALALFTGKIDACFTSTGLAGHSLAEGQDFSIGMAVAVSNQALLARPDILEPADLREKRIGVIGKTSDSYYLMKWYLEAEGVDVDSEAVIVEVKNPATLTTFYLNGQIDAIVTWGSFAREVESSGGHVMVTQSECLEALIDRPYYTPLALVSNEMVEIRPETSRSLMRALREGIVEVESGKDQAVDFLSGISDESSDTIRTNLDAKFLGDMNQTIQQDLVEYFDYATQRGFFPKPIPGDVFYDEWT